MPGVQDEGPAAARQLVGERAAEPLGGTGDDGNGRSHALIMKLKVKLSSRASECEFPIVENRVGQPVVDRLLCRQHQVAVGVLPDQRRVAAGVQGQDLLHLGAQPDDLLRLQGEVGQRALPAAGRLVQHHP